MVIFNSTFTANSKKTSKPFYCVKLFEKRESQDKSIYFKDVQFFVEKSVFDNINKSGFKFGDIVDIITEPAQYIGGTDSLIGLTLLTDSPFYD